MISPIPTRAHLRDLSEFARIQTASFPPHLAYKRWMLLVFWCFPGVTFAVTRDGEKVTGGIISDTHHGMIRIMNIAVHPDYRRHGIGRALMRSVLDARPHDSAVLMVQEENTAAQALYRELGFEHSGYLGAYYGPGRGGIEMTLRRG
ncbi:MAG: GNAT family N-acetyltransferase [Thermomicrobiales bacterium]|nr:GNAT family N-acetyltransferase [Thermomicrobiales bacterium]